MSATYTVKQHDQQGVFLARLLGPGNELIRVIVVHDKTIDIVQVPRVGVIQTRTHTAHRDELVANGMDKRSFPGLSVPTGISKRPFSFSIDGLKKGVCHL